MSLPGETGLTLAQTEGTGTGRELEHSLLHSRFLAQLVPSKGLIPFNPQDCFTSTAIYYSEIGSVTL